ncbi:MAG: hypothetical protein RLZZ385_1662 [Pseudomonadota bacterium]|jgi:hypothetical protein
MKQFDGHPSFQGSSASSIVKWFYDRAWNTMTGAKRAIDDIFETNCGELVRQRLFPEERVPQTQEELDNLLMETNSSYTEAVNECVRVFRNGLTDDSEEELEILESKLLSAREKLDRNVGAIESELIRRRQKRKS